MGIYPSTKEYGAKGSICSSIIAFTVYYPIFTFMVDEYKADLMPFYNIV